MPDDIANVLNEEQMKQQSSFFHWDFVGETVNGTEDIWRMCSDGIHPPKLAWEFGKFGDFTCPAGAEFECF